MKLPNREYPVEVTEVQDSILKIRRVIRDMRNKKQEFLIAKRMADNRPNFAIFRKFNDDDNFIWGKDRSRLDREGYIKAFVTRRDNIFDWDIL